MTSLVSDAYKPPVPSLERVVRWTGSLLFMVSKDKKWGLCLSVIFLHLLEEKTI